MTTPSAPAIPAGDGSSRATRIAGLAALLSLDVTRSFFRDFTRLDVDVDAFQASLRKLILEVRSEAEAEQKAPHDFEDRWRAVVEAEHGEEVATSLWWFIDHVYFVGWAERPSWNGWRLAFEIATLRPVEQRAFAQALGDVQREVFDAFDALDKADELHNQIASVRAAETTEWDLDVYARRSWDPKSDVGAPFRVIRDGISLWHFRDLMVLIDRSLDDDAQARLTALANGLLDDLGAYKPSALPTPEGLVGVAS